MDFLYFLDVPYLINAALRFVILVFLIALFILFAGLGVQKRRLARRVKEDHEFTQNYIQHLVAIQKGRLQKIDLPHSIRHLICLGRAYRDCIELRPSDITFTIDAPISTKHFDLLKQGLASKNFGARYQVIDTIANLQLCDFFIPLLQHSTEEKNSLASSHCLYASALLLRDGDEFNALASRLDSDSTLSTNLVEGISRVAIQQLVKHQPLDIVHQHLSSFLMISIHSQLFKVGLVNAIGKEKIDGLKNTLILLAQPKDGLAVDPSITLAVMRAISSFGQFDSLIRTQLLSEHPTTQVVAIRSSIHGEDTSLELVAKQLYSMHFDVRYAAAMTLAKLGTRGQQLLKKASINTDRYAQNIATFALAIG